MKLISKIWCWIVGHDLTKGVELNNEHYASVEQRCLRCGEDFYSCQQK